VIAMKIFVTGSAGFIGSHLVRTLKSGNNEVAEFDKLLDDAMDITSEEAISHAICKFEPDAVIHLAANANPRVSVDRPNFDLTINTLGTVNALRAVSKLNVKPFFVLMSSAFIYGDVSENPVSELTLPRPNSPYGISKLAAEQYVQFFSKPYAYKYAILRLFNIYGGGQRSGYVVPDLIQRVQELRRGDALEMRGNENDIRDFLFVDDLMNLFTRLIQIKPENEIFNVGSGYPVRIRDLAIMITRNIGLDVSLKYNGGASKASIFYSNPEKIRDAISWEPRTSLEDGIAGTVRTMLSEPHASA
jgi:UDP-glucose 4-epimerase